MTKILSNKSNIDLDYPICRPSLDLDFTQEVLDPRITFSRGSIGTRVNRNRLIETVSANQPRFDYDPVTGECKGLLIEETRTNLLTNSNTDVEFSNGARPNTWTSGQLAPDGSSTAKLCVTNNRSFKEYISASVNNVVSTFSIYLKTNGSIVTRTFDLRDISSDTVRTTKTITITPNWQRFDITGTVQSNGIRVEIIGGIFNIFAWGAQLEAGAFPTSYIPTTASTVTRSADNAQMTGTNFSSWYNSSEGTLYSNISIIRNLTTDSTGSWSLDNSSYANGYTLSHTNTTSSRLSVRGPNTSSSGRSIGDVTNVDITKFKNCCIILPSVTNRILSCSNGNFSGIEKSFSSGVSLNRLNIGFNNIIGTPANNYLNGTISRLTYYPRALKPNQLQFLTA